MSGIQLTIYLSAQRERKITPSADHSTEVRELQFMAAGPATFSCFASLGPFYWDYRPHGRYSGRSSGGPFPWSHRVTSVVLHILPGSDSCQALLTDPGSPRCHSVLLGPTVSSGGRNFCTVLSAACDVSENGFAARYLGTGLPSPSQRTLPCSPGRMEKLTFIFHCV